MLQLSHAKEDLTTAGQYLAEVSAAVDSGAQHDIDVDTAIQILQSVTAVQSAEEVKQLQAAQKEMRAVLERALQDGQKKLAEMRLKVCAPICVRMAYKNDFIFMSTKEYFTCYSCLLLLHACYS